MGEIVCGGGLVKEIVHKFSDASFFPDKKGRLEAGEKKLTAVLENTAQPSGRSRGATPRRLWERAESGHIYAVTEGRLGRVRSPPSVAVIVSELGIVKVTGGTLQGKKI